MINRLFFKITWVILAYFLCLGLYKLIFSDDSILSYNNLQNQITKQQQINNSQTEINTALYAEVKNLKQGYSAIEERARRDLGLIKKGEIFYQLIE